MNTEGVNLIHAFRFLKNKINQIFIMNKLFCLFLFLSLSAFRPPHPIHLCKSDLEYHAPSKTLRLTIAIFIDDLLFRRENTALVRLRKIKANKKSIMILTSIKFLGITTFLISGPASLLIFYRCIDWIRSSIYTAAYNNNITF